MFLDEAGISSRESFVIVAGVIVDGDAQLIRLERRLTDLTAEFIPAAQRDDFYFHATDIWSGKRFFADKSAWPLSVRLAILHGMARIVRRLGLSVIHDAVSRAETRFPDHESHTPHELNVSLHSLAFTTCALRTELAMRVRHRTEVAQLVVEHNESAQRKIAEIHQLLRKPIAGMNSHPLVPLKCIRGSVLFATKRESLALQIADFCAFVLRGYYSGNARVAPLFQKIKSQIVWLPKSAVYRGPLVECAPNYRATLEPRQFTEEMIPHLSRIIGELESGPPPSIKFR